MNPVGSKSPAADANALESAIGGKLAVWVGAIALALGGVFLVKYSIDQDWLGPQLRVLGGLVLGAGLGGAAWRLRDRSNYVAQGLAAGAVICIYSCLWAAVDLYQLIPPVVGLMGMVVTTALAVAGALRLGPLVAIIGLLGAFLAPLLVGRESSQPAALFAYLLALQAGSQFVARKRRWAWASGIAMGAGAVWVLLHLVGNGAEHVWPGLFLLGSTAVFMLPELLKPEAGKGSVVAVWCAGAGGTLLLAITLGVSAFEPSVWAFFAVLIAGTGVLAIWQRRYAMLPWLTFGISIVLAGLHLYAADWSARGSLGLLAGLGALYLAIGFSGMWRGDSPSYRGLVAAAPGAFILLAMPFLWHDVAALGPYAWMFVFLAAAGTYAALGVPVIIGRNLLRPHDVSAVLVPAFLFAGVAWPLGLEAHWCVMLWGAQLVAAAGLDRAYRLEAVRFTGVLLLVGIGVLLLSPGVLFIADGAGTMPLLNRLTAVYAAAIVACLIARALAPESYRSLYSISALLFILAGAGANIHHVTHGGDLLVAEFPALEVSSHVTVMLIVALWLLMRAPHVNDKSLDQEDYNLRGFGLGLATVAMTAGAFLLATAGNPWVRHEPVHGVPLLNTLLLSVGLPAALIGLIARSVGERGYAQHRLVAWWVFGGLVTLGVMLEVRHLFHGGELWTGKTIDAEHYAYSISLALLALLALGLGIRKDSRQLRVVALAGMLACSIKVFAFDMRHLEGIFRVLSFLGLGGSLMCLGYVYNRFGPKPSKEPELPSYDECVTDTVPL